MGKSIPHPFDPHTLQMQSLPNMKKLEISITSCGGNGNVKWKWKMENGNEQWKWKMEMENGNGKWTWKMDMEMNNTS